MVEYHPKGREMDAIMNTGFLALPVAVTSSATAKMGDFDGWIGAGTGLSVAGIPR
jgi:hypothetical protein